MPTSSAAFAVAPFVVAFLIPYLGTALWVSRDARRRGCERSAQWTAVVLLAGPAFLFGFAVYVLARRGSGDGTPAERIDHVLRNVVVAAVASFAIVGVVSPPDPITQAYALAIALPVLVVVAVFYEYRDVLSSAG